MGQRIGNTKRVEWGIEDEDADYRAHVSVSGRGVYFFETQSAIDTIKNGNYSETGTWNNTLNIQTSWAWLVPYNDIKHQFVSVSAFELLQAGFKSPLHNYRQMTTSQKGRAAENIVKYLIEIGRLVLPQTVEEIKDRTTQISGLDIVVKEKVKIQVKCDWNAGKNGTGNLYIEFASCNPFKEY